MESSLQIKMVRENLALAIALWAAANRQVITAAFLPGRSEFIAENGEIVEVSSPLALRDNRELVRCVNNQIRGAFAFSAIQTHRVLESVYGPSPLREPDPDLKAARCALYLLHATMNQNLIEPVWVCPLDYRRRFEVRPASFTLDASTLDGEKVYWDHFGGLARYLDLLEYCGSQVGQQLAAPAQLQLPAEEATVLAAPAEALAQGTPGRESVVGFVAGRCVVGPTAMIVAKDLYDAYLDWCQREGQEPLQQRNFGMRLTALGFERRRRGRGRHWWVGVGLAAWEEGD